MAENMKIIITNSSTEPIYQQIIDQIKTQIISDSLKAEDLLPSIRGLAKELRISVITVKRAYEDLEREGFVETVGGKGTYVAFQNKEFIKEKKMKSIEDKLSEAIDDAKMIGLGVDEVKEMIELLYG